MMNFKRLLLSGVLCTSIFISSTTGVFALSSTYTVQKGDTYWKISQKVGVPIGSLMSANNATQSTVLNVGQIISVPVVHSVKAGETYWTISKSYGVDFYELLRTNNATDKSWLNVGDKVTIPDKNQVSAYIVQPGDTYWIVSQKFDVDINKLLSLNGANANFFYIQGSR
jgi:LysM repeat protein